MQNVDLSQYEGCEVVEVAPEPTVLSVTPASVWVEEARERLVAHEESRVERERERRERREREELARLLAKYK